MNDLKPVINPNTKQMECIRTVNGPVMVLAGPGTGKTFTIIQRIKYMLQECINPTSILCLTYSEAAANEMKARLVKEIGTIASAVTINTYHAFCNDIIKQYPNEFELLDGVSLVDEITKQSIMKETLEEVKPEVYRTKWGDAFYFIPELLKVVDEIKSNQVTKDEYFYTLKTHPAWQGKMDELIAEYNQREQKGKLVKTFLNNFESHKKKMAKAKEAWDIYEKYDIKLKQKNFIDFNDMINMVLEVFDSNDDFLKKVSSKYQYFLVDEYQDTNYSQNSIVFKLAEGANSENIFVVGDDDQIIYEFQGAKTDTLEKFLIKYPQTKVICLNENNRSTQNILDFSYKIISQDKTRLEYNEDFSKYNISKVLIAKNPQITPLNKKIQFHGFADIKQENNFIVKEIENIISSDNMPINKEGKKDLSKIAILTRENNELNTFASLLEAKNIQFQIKESKNIFDIKSSLVIYFYLKALLNHEFNGDKLFGLLLAEPFNFANEDYSYLLEQNRLNHKDLISNIRLGIENDYKWSNSLRVKSFIQTFDSLIGLKSNLNIKDLIIEVINRTGILDFFLNNEINKSENIYAIKKIIDEAQSFLYIKKGAWLGDFLEHLDTAFESNIPITIDKEDYTQNAIQLLTLHGSKGREFEYVFMPNLIAKKWEGKRVNNTMSLPIDKSDKKTDEDTQRRSEQLRLLFVGVTRAKHTLYLSYSNAIDTNPQELTTYLSEAIQDDNLIESYNHELEKQEYLLEVAQMLKKEPFDYAKAFKDELKARIENFIISPSTLNSYLNCPRCFLYSYVLNIPVLDRETASAHYGNAIHRTLQWVVQYAKENSQYPIKDDVIKSFERNLSKEKFETEEKREEFRIRGIKCFDKYYKQILETPYTRIYSTEYSFNYVPFESHFLKGFIDRIEKNNDGTIELYDYKTGSAKPKSQIADGKDYENYLNQLRFYKYAYEIQNHDIKVTKAGLIFVEEPDCNFYINLTEEDNKIIETKIKYAYDNILELNFKPESENKKACEYCNYKHLCKLADL